MEDRLFGRTPEQLKKKKEINARSILHCNTERKRLRECFRESWFGYCSKEQSAFWDCFNKVCVREEREGQSSILCVNVLCHVMCLPRGVYVL